MDDSLKDLPSWVAQLVVILNVLLALAGKVGLLAGLLAGIAKGWEAGGALVHHWFEVAKEKANQNKILAQTQVDDIFFDSVEKAVMATGQAIKEELKKQLTAGKITPAEFSKALHEDAKARLLASLSEGKKEVIQAAYKDLGVAADAVIPGIVAKLKLHEKLGTTPNS